MTTSYEWKHPESNSFKLEILLRVCNRREVNPTLTRIVDVSRNELILRCLKSLVTSLNNLYLVFPQQKANVTIIGGLDTDFEKCFLDVMSKCFYKWDFTNKDLFNNESMKYCYEFAKNHFLEDNTVIYFAEDDYLYFPNCFVEMIKAYKLFKDNLGVSEVAIHPQDSPLEYYPKYIYPCRIVLGNDRHWRTSVSSSFTMLISKDAFIKFNDKFMDYAKFDGVNYHEANTINLMFISGVNLFTPIPTLCFHIGYIDPPSPFCDYKELWETNS